MQRILSIKQALSQSILVLGSLLLISIFSLLIFVQSPSYAATYSSEFNLTPEEKIDRAYEYSEATGLKEEDREQAYEAALKDAKSTGTMEKAYERNLKAEKSENQPSLIKKAEEFVEKVTGKE